MAKPRTPRNNRTIAPGAPETSTVTQAASPNPPAAFIATQIDLEAQIRQRAYQLYEERGCTPGQENEDWFRAEQEVRAHIGQHNA